MLALGLVGVLGVTLVQATAQPAPSPYGAHKEDPKGSGGPAIPLLPGVPVGDAVLPPLPPGPEIKLPPLVADAAAPAVMPAGLPMTQADPGIDIKPVVGPPPVIKTGNQ